MPTCFCRLGLRLFCATCLFGVAAPLLPAQPPAETPQNPTELPQMLEIKWELGPSLPRGFQDSDGGIIDDVLISIGGFCSGMEGVPGKPDKYPRRFMKDVLGIDLKHPEKGWQVLPEYPGVARQGLDAAVVNNAIYCWGGFSYEEPWVYRDGYRLSRRDGQWVWDSLPDFPNVATSAGSCVIGTKIYMHGGADYDYTKFLTQTDRDGGFPRMGARLRVIDTADLEAGWKDLPECPGTPRYVHTVAAVGGKLYIIGGATGSDNPGAGTYTVVDNWRFDPVTESWERLADLPVASGNFPSGPVVFRDRYIVLIGGYQYGHIMHPDGSLGETYGTVTRHFQNNPMCSDVFVYDAETGKFGRATPLPLNNNLPMAVLQGDRLYQIGGEIQDAIIEGEHFGHHPDLYLVGTIQPAS